MIARVFLRNLGLEPDKDVAIIQVGGGGERAAAFRTGRIAAFPAPPGVLHLTKGVPQRVLISTAEFQKPYPFPYICGTTTRSFLSTNRATVKRLVMALTEGVQFFKTRKEESKQILAKYSRQNNEAYLEAAYEINAKLFERTPYVGREGMEIQLKEALAKKPTATVKVDDIVDDRLSRNWKRKALSTSSTGSKFKLPTRLERFEPFERIEWRHLKSFSDAR